MLNLLIGPIAELAGTWMSGKVEEKKAQSATKVAKAQAEAVVMQKKLRVKLTGTLRWQGEVSHRGKTNGLQYYLVYHLF